VRLEALPNGGIAAAPRSMLNDTDRRLLRQYWQAVYGLLCDEETFGC
jgi:hypothetical protein